MLGCWPRHQPTACGSFPNANYFGGSTVTLRAWDQTTGTNGGLANTTTSGGTTAFSSATDTAAITVLSVNDVPSFTKGGDQVVAEDAGAQSVAGWATSLSRGPANESGQTLAFAITGNSNAALFSAGPTVSPTGTLTFTPAANANGTSTISLVIADNGGTANGGIDTSAAQSFVVSVGAVNDAPACADDAASTDEDTPLNDSLACTDVEGDTLTYAEVAGPSDGTLLLNPDGTFTYTPDPDFNGSDSFTFTADDGSAVSNVATFTITVPAVNDAPVCADDTATTNEDTPLAGFVSCTDVDGDTLTYAEVTGPSNGTLAVNTDGSFTYTPDADFNGSDSFTFTADDGTESSNTATFTITVTAVNDAPVCADDADSTDEDTPLAGSVTCTDVDGDALTYASGTDPANGTLTFNPDGTFTYTPDPDFNGTDSFTFTANDGADGSNTATVHHHGRGRQRRAGLRRRCGHHRRGHTPGRQPRLHRRRGRWPDLCRGQRPDQRQRSCWLTDGDVHLYPGCQLQRHRQLHLHGRRRHRLLEHRDRSPSRSRPSTTRRCAPTTRQSPTRTHPWPARSPAPMSTVTR